MRARFTPTVLLVAAMFLAGPARPAQASDGRNGPEVGSLRHAHEKIGAVLQAPAGPPAPARPDSLANGAAIGAGLGAMTGVALTAWAYARCDDNCEAPAPGPMYTLGAAFGAGIGAVTGLLIDAARKDRGPRVAVGAVVLPRQKHVTVGWKW